MDFSNMHKKMVITNKDNTRYIGEDLTVTTNIAFARIYSSVALAEFHSSIQSIGGSDVKFIQLIQS